MPTKETAQILRMPPTSSKINKKLKEMLQRSLDITEYYNTLRTLSQELDMHYEVDRGNLEGILSLKGISRKRGCMNS